MLRLGRIFSDGMVFRREVPFTIWGWSDCREIECRLEGPFSERVCADSDEAGYFRASFSSRPGGKSVYSLRVTAGGEEVRVGDILFGDVILTMGQSNMAYPLSSTESRKSADRLASPEVRILDLKEAPFTELSEVTRPALPQADLREDFGWITTEGDACLGVSALSVLTAFGVHAASGMPVGVVHASMGGLCAESYLPRAAADADPDLAAQLRKLGRYSELEQWNDYGERNFTQLSGVFNEKIAPIAGFSLSAMVWYLGESSAWDYEFARLLKREMSLLVSEYRKLFGDIPFLVVQIAPEYYGCGDGYGYLYVNEALSDFCRETPDCYCIPIYDVRPRWLIADGDYYYHPIHPVNKAPVARRIADTLSALLKGNPRRFPEIGEVIFDREGATCVVQNAGRGIKGPLQGFTLAGADGKYVQATARAVGPDRIRVTSGEVPNPVAVTYAFMQYQEDCRAQAGGLPLLPFRSRREPVKEGYFFPPAFLNFGKREAYENCFGWQVGTCHRVKRWESGRIYRTGRVKLSPCRWTGQEEAVLKISAKPGNYDLFGISPALCLSGRPSHLADFAYWNFELAAPEGEVLFLGGIARLCSGQTIRFSLGEEDVPEIFLESFFRPVTLSLQRGLRQDGAPLGLTPELRQKIVEVEFLFRSRTPCTVLLGNMALSDRPRQASFDRGKFETNLRADIQLPAGK